MKINVKKQVSTKAFRQLVDFAQQLIDANVKATLLELSDILKKYISDLRPQLNKYEIIKHDSYGKVWMISIQYEGIAYILITAP